MQTIEGFDFFHLGFDKEGKLDPAAGELEALNTRITTAAVTDVLFIAHGFRNDENDATGLYTNFLKTFGANRSRPEFQASLGGRIFAIGGVFWPSQQYPEAVDTDPNAGHVQGIDTDATELAEARTRLLDLRDHYANTARKPALDRALALLPSLKGSPDNQDDFVRLVLSLLDDTTDDPTEGGRQVRAQSGSDLLGRFGAPVILPTDADDDDGGVTAVGDFAAGTDGGVQGLGGFFGSVFGQVNQLLNFTTWYVMKDRAGTVGAVGMAEVVRAVHAAHPDVKIHLVGHSLGGRLMAACAKALSAAPLLQVDSLILLEAAFSHYGFSPDNGHGTPGFFRDVIAKKVVKGPTIATYSVQDTVVGYAYAIVSRLAGDNAKKVGDADDEFGGIGRNGTQKTAEAVQDVLHAAGVSYQFRDGVVSNLDGSGGLIKDHGDVTNDTVTYAVAAAVSRT